jgi:hypothetical protein
MGYTVDLQGVHLACRTEDDAKKAAAVVKAHGEMCPYHLEVHPRCMSNPPHDASWVLDVDYFAGDCWRDENAQKLWMALTPHMKDGAYIEFQGEDCTRWRIRWEGGKTFEEYPKRVIWALERELAPEGGSL